MGGANRYCVLRCEKPETQDHLFFPCTYSFEVWVKLNKWTNTDLSYVWEEMGDTAMVSGQEVENCFLRGYVGMSTSYCIQSLAGQKHLNLPKTRDAQET